MERRRRRIVIAQVPDRAADPARDDDVEEPAHGECDDPCCDHLDRCAPSADALDRPRPIPKNWSVEAMRQQSFDDEPDHIIDDHDPRYRL